MHPREGWQFLLKGTEDVKKWLVAFGILATVTGFAFWVASNSARFESSVEMSVPSLPETCRIVAFEAVDHVVCEVDPGEYDIAMSLKGRDGTPYGSLAALAKSKTFIFAMNAGMYHHDKSPVGLYVENGEEAVPLNRSEGDGNFFLKPNGVFYVDQSGMAGVQETEAFAASAHRVNMATQSGPMLVIDGAIHPRFLNDGSSRYIRNGVGVRGNGTAVFAISKSALSLGSFARLFRDALDCPNALFFDGGISALHDGSHYLVGGRNPAGPIVTVARKN